jgi:hypothetical protein
MARATCSIVRSGFFSPKPSRLLGDEQQHQLAQNHVPEQALPVSSFVMAKADLGFGHSKRVFDIPAAKAHLQERG